MSEIFNYIDYIGTFVFAITGASIAGKSKFDFFGMLFLAFLTAVGGGTVRDLICNCNGLLSYFLKLNRFSLCHRYLDLTKYLYLIYLEK